MRQHITGLLTLVLLLALAVPVLAQDGPGAPDTEDDTPMGFDIAFSGVYFDTATGVINLTVHNNDERDIDFRLENGALATTPDGTNDGRGFTVLAGETLTLNAEAGGIVLPDVPEELPDAVPFLLTASVGGPASIEMQPLPLAAPVLDEAPDSTPLTFRSGWARNTFPNSAGYVLIANSSDDDIEITAAVAPQVNVVELHNTDIDDDGVMRMRPIERFVIPAGGSLLLQPGGMHLMLIGVDSTVDLGNAVRLTLTLDDDTEVPIALPVLDTAPMGFPAGMDMMDMDMMDMGEMEMSDMGDMGDGMSDAEMDEMTDGGAEGEE